MSEPIQSIAQNNYILQGTVATSAGIVGDGSTQNPLQLGITYYKADNQSSGVFTTKAAAGIDVVGVNAFKCGDIVSIYGSLDPAAAITIAAGTWTKLGTVNTDLIPNSNVSFPFAIGQSNSQLAGVFRITSAGDFEIRQPATTNSFGRSFTITYSTIL